MRIRGGGVAVVLAILPCLATVGWCCDQESSGEAAPITSAQPPQTPPVPQAAPIPQTGPAILPLTAGKRAKYHIRRALGPESFAGNAFSSGLQTWRGRPEGWGQDAEGFMQRFGMRASRAVIGNGITFGVGELMKDDPRYRPSGRKGWGRLSYAVTRSVVHHDRQGRPIPAYSRFAGVVGANVITRSWFPPGDDRWSDVGWRCAGQMGWGVAWNILREFTPDIKRKLGR